MYSEWQVYEFGIFTRLVTNVNISGDFLKSSTKSFFQKLGIDGKKSFVHLFVWLSFNYILYLYTWLLTWCMQHDLILCKNSTTHCGPTLPRGSWSEQTWICAIWGCFHKCLSLFLTKIKYLWISSTLTTL